MLEVAANLFNVASVWFAARNSVHTWWTGIVGCALFAFVFLEARLYGDLTLQVWFVGSCVVGWWRWVRVSGVAEERPVSRSSAAGLVGGASAAALFAVVYGTVLSRTTNAAFPIVDSFVLTGSVLAQVLLMERKVETWWFWIAVDLVAVPLYASRGLNLTAAVYAVFLVNAAYGWWAWERGLARR